MSMNALPATLLEAVKFFSNSDNCREYLVARRWPNGVTCPTCGSQTVYFDRSRNGWECKTRHPHRKFTLKTGTIFEDSPLGLDKWLPVVWMIANCKNGVSSWEIHRAIGVTQKTAWFMLQRVRLAMQDTNSGGKLGGDVEVDETYIGAKARNMHASKKRRIGLSQTASMVGKAAVMGLLQRHPEKGKSTIRLSVIGGRRRTVFQPTIAEHVAPGATVHTDTHPSYGDMPKDYIHKVINHAEKYVDGNVHTNGCENFWSLLKRGLKGTYVSVEPFHLFRYLDEQAFRFNNRKDMTDADRFSAVIANIVGRRLTYKNLIGPVDQVLPV
ncbi:MAG TPA: IS1595 family transposase [Vicinamibacterales bacterium]|nr:IS1595 family transposase [Vicinamibacterales bacterium]